MKVMPLVGAGAEIKDIALQSASEQEFVIIKETFADYGLIFFRNQALTEDDHIALAKRFGPVVVNRFFAAHPDYPEIALVTKEKHQETNIGGGWHTDHSYDTEPAMGSILVARELPKTGGDTWFVSMYQAMDNLSEGLKQTLRGLRAVHSAKHIFGNQGGYQATEDVAGDRIGNPEAAAALEDPVHPVVIVHPLSGKEALYVNPAFTLNFEGWTPEESAPLLNYLYQQSVQPADICRFEWQPGSIAFWDNRATWHFAQNDYAGQRREMHRITIGGCKLNSA